MHATKFLQGTGVSFGIEGLRHKSLPIFSVRYHPEAAPGPATPELLSPAFCEADRGRAQAAPEAGKARLFPERDLVVFQRPLAHETHARGADAVDDERGIFRGAEVAAEKRVAFPDLAEQHRVGEDFGDAGDSNLIVPVVEVAQFHFRI